MFGVEGEFGGELGVLVVGGEELVVELLNFVFPDCDGLFKGMDAFVIIWSRVLEF